MRWILAGIAFALMVCLAVGTVAIRTENVRTRRRVEVEWNQLLDRRIELDRVRAVASEQSSPRVLAHALRRVLLEISKRRAAHFASGAGALAGGLADAQSEAMHAFLESRVAP